MLQESIGAIGVRNGAARQAHLLVDRKIALHGRLPSGRSANPSSCTIAQNGLPTGGERPVAGGANGGGGVAAGMVALPSTATATATPTHACTATIGLIGVTGIGINY